MGRRSLDPERGRAIEAAFLEWRRRWPQAYGHIIAVLEAHHAVGEPCTLAKAVEDTRKRDYTDAQGLPFRGINNTIQAAMQRAILAERPHLGGTLGNCRASHLDAMGGDDGSGE